MMSDIKNIVLLEDEPDDVFLISRQLKKSGIEAEIRVCVNKQEFEELLSQLKPDIILADYDVPGFYGYEALLLSRSHDASIPFIFITGCMLPNSIKEEIESRAEAYTLKDDIKELPILIEKVWIEFLARNITD
ncbi:MAG: hypothetical protein CMO01_08090 [Thalassobius sp.]|nr:hypothetical protein [Thalassovita sp.]